jgi:glyoxylase-like metal-dependent hydrolase (beta-lactamase superfamily II)
VEELKVNFMQTDAITIKTLDTGIFGLDGGSMFGIIPKALWTKAYSEPDEANRIPLAARPILIQFQDRNVLVDTGNGNKFNEKQQKIYNIDVEKSNVENALKTVNLKPTDITDVILTHLHFDHCGGSTKLEDGKIVPTFPNARYYVQKEHWEWAIKPTEKDAGSFMPNDFLPLYEFGVMDFVEGEVLLFDKIEIKTLYGHTPAMKAVKISVDDRIYFYPADLFPTSAHLNLPYILAYDNYPLTTLEEKKKYLANAIEEDWIVIFEHDAFVKAGKIGYSNGKYFVREKVDL